MIPLTKGEKQTHREQKACYIKNEKEEKKKNLVLMMTIKNTLK